MNKYIIYIVILCMILVYIIYDTYIYSEDYNNYFANCNLQDTLLIIIDESICKVYKDQPFYQDVTQDKIDTFYI